MDPREEQSLKNAAKAATGPDKSGKGLSSTARMIKALSQTSELVQQMTSQIDKDTKKAVDIAISAEAHAASTKQAIKDKPSTELQDWEISAREIITEVSNERKTQASGEELTAKLKNIDEATGTLRKERSNLLSEVDKVISELQKLIPELVTKLKSGNVSSSEVKDYVTKISNLDQEAIKYRTHFDAIYTKEGDQINSYRSLHKQAKDVLTGASISVKTAEPSPRPE